MHTAQAPAPPKGFRKPISVRTRLSVVLTQEGRCTTCGERLGSIDDLEFDHVPALQLRGWDPDTNDTVPPADDPGAIQAKHKDCHGAKTSGRKGESKLSKVGGDTSEVAKLRRLTRKEEEFRSKILAKSNDDEPQPEQKRKRKIPSRPFPGSRKDKTEQGSRS